MKIQTNTWKIISGVIIALLVLVIVWLGVLLLSRSDSPEIETAVEVEQLERSVTGKSYSQDVEEVMVKTQDLVKEAVAIQKDGLEDVLKGIDDGDFSSLPDSFKNKFRFVSELDTSENKILAYQSTLIFSANIAKVNKNLGLVEGSANAVFLDQEAGVASVPVSVFTGANSGLYFQWVWVDGEWMFSPYPNIQSSILAASVAEAS